MSERRFKIVNLKTGHFLLKGAQMRWVADGGNFWKTRKAAEYVLDYVHEYWPSFGDVKDIQIREFELHWSPVVVQKGTIYERMSEAALRAALERIHRMVYEPGNSEWATIERVGVALHDIGLGAP